MQAKLNLLTINKFLLVALMSFVLANPLVAQPVYENELPEANSVDQAEEFMQLGPQAAKERAKTLTKGEAQALASQILRLKRETVSDIDHVYFVLSQIERVRAMEIAQEQLNDLLWVLGIVIGIFVLFVAYVFFDQRRSIAKLQELLEKGDLAVAADTDKTTEVYRGEGG